MRTDEARALQVPRPPAEHDDQVAAPNPPRASSIPTNQLR